ncbi:MAG: hypothetical protein F4Y02_15485 [Chloroflexi bacterium]|nr:hypothetical protein [Chloroflexota bacterium]
MSTYKNLTSACIAAVLALGLAACSSSNDSADAPPAEPPPPVTMEPDHPAHETVTVDVALGMAEQAALLMVLQDTGDSDTLTVAAGETEERADVEFTCMSEYECTFTITNNLGTIVATMSSEKHAGEDDPTATAMVPPGPMDTFPLLNAGSTDSIRDDVVRTAGTEVDAGTAGPNFTPTELIGMGIGGPGVLNADDAGLRSDFQANGDALTDADGDPVEAAGPGLAPVLADGTTITGADDAVDPSADMETAPAGWGMKTLFRDWGDTAGDGDGGFETAAIVVKNLGDGMPHPFDRDLADNYVNTAAQAMFTLGVRADGTAPGVTTLGTSVYIGVDELTVGAVTLPLAASVQWANMEFDSDSLVGAQSQDLNVNATETFSGSYFGAPGEFQCIAATGTSCGIARGDDGIIRVNDTNAAPDVVASTGRWTFTPDPGAMITVPDQDWIAYGAWLTTPDDAAGDHRLGVFFNGMDPWTPAANALDATNAAGLRGSATYNGGATGIYVDGDDSGLFTARATLTAVFDENMDGVDAADEDYRISGRIDNFRGTDGVALGADTGDMPNPQGRGENDWVVELGSVDIAETGVIAATGTTGSADGVSWTGMWNGQFFGPSEDDGDAIAPSGVAGRFWAETADPDAADADMNPVTAVTGAFGATR